MQDELPGIAATNPAALTAATASPATIASYASASTRRCVGEDLYAEPAALPKPSASSATSTATAATTRATLGIGRHCSGDGGAAEDLWARSHNQESHGNLYPLVRAKSNAHIGAGVRPVCSQAADW